MITFNRCCLIFILIKPGKPILLSFIIINCHSNDILSPTFVNMNLVTCKSIKVNAENHTTLLCQMAHHSRHQTVILPWDGLHLPCLMSRMCQSTIPVNTYTTQLMGHLQNTNLLTVLPSLVLLAVLCVYQSAACAQRACSANCKHRAVEQLQPPPVSCCPGQWTSQG